MNKKGMFTRQRSSRWIDEALLKKRSALLKVDTLGSVTYGNETYEIWYATQDASALRSGVPTVLVTAGVHGNEPAPVDAAMSIIDALPQFTRRCRIVVVPCVNPSGYEAATRENAAGIDVNRTFGIEPGSQEAQVLMNSWLADERFLLTVDMHETLPDEENGEYGKDDNPTSFYLYESCRIKRRRVARHVLRRVKNAGEAVCTRPTIYGDENANGVLWYPEACKNAEYAAGTSLDSWLLRGLTPNAIVTETPAWQQPDRRRSTQVLALRAAIEETLRRYPRGKPRTRTR